MKQAVISTLLPGTEIRYRDRAAVVLEHKDSGVFVQLLDRFEQDRTFGKTNDWRTCELRQHLNGDFAKMLTEGNLDELLDTVADLTAMDGTTDYGHSVDKVTLLTIDQCRKYRYIRPLADEWEWTSTPDSTPGGWDENARFVRVLNTSGNLSNGNCTNTNGVRPAFTLPSTLTVGAPSNNGLAGYTDTELLGELLKRQQSK